MYITSLCPLQSYTKNILLLFTNLNELFNENAKLTTSLCSSLFNSDVIFMSPINTKKIPNNTDKLFKTIDDPMMCLSKSRNLQYRRGKIGTFFSEFFSQVLSFVEVYACASIFTLSMHTTLHPHFFTPLYSPLGKWKRKFQIREECFYLVSLYVRGHFIEGRERVEEAWKAKLGITIKVTS